MSVAPLSEPFEPHLHELFLERIEESKNMKALDWIDKQDFTRVGVTCGTCKLTKPFYCYKQQNQCRNGMQLNRCSKCRIIVMCPWSRMLGNMKNKSKRRGHGVPGIGINDLKRYYSQQRGRCYISGVILGVKHGDRDPYNISPERLDNNLGYVEGNVVLICQFLQIGHGHDYKPPEIRSWFNYDVTGDGFVFDPSIFEKIKKARRKKRKSIQKYSANGTVLSKTCTDCGIDKSMSGFSGTSASCKRCVLVRNTERINGCPRDFIKKIVSDSKYNSNARSSKRRRNDDSGVISSDLFGLFVSVITRQGGRCVVTGIPFIYQKGHTFAPSPDRIDNTKGYVDGNVEFVIAPLNTQCKPPNSELRTLIKRNDLF